MSVQYQEFQDWPAEQFAAMLIHAGFQSADIFRIVYGVHFN